MQAMQIIRVKQRLFRSVQLLKPDTILLKPDFSWLGRILHETISRKEIIHLFLDPV